MLAGEDAPLGLGDIEGMVNGEVELELRHGGQAGLLVAAGRRVAHRPRDARPRFDATAASRPTPIIMRRDARDRDPRAGGGAFLAASTGLPVR